MLRERELFNFYSFLNAQPFSSKTWLDPPDSVITEVMPTLMFLASAALELYVIPQKGWSEFFF